MAKSKIVYSDIKWDEIDYTVVSKVKDICRSIKEYYWNNRPKGSSQSKIIESGLDYDFLIKAFSIYHTEWKERTFGITKIDFLWQYLLHTKMMKSVNLFTLYWMGKCLLIVQFLIIFLKLIVLRKT